MCGVRRFVREPAGADSPERHVDGGRPAVLRWPVQRARLQVDLKTCFFIIKVVEYEEHFVINVIFIH